MSLGRSPKQPLPRIGLHDPLHGRQACPELNSFNQGLVKYVPGRDYFLAAPSQNGDTFVTPPPPPVVERLFSTTNYYTVELAPVAKLTQHLL